jgi:hypothetical protein
MSKHKKQHYVPSCYLKAWCDPNTPSTQTPYLWVFDKNGENPRKKAPDNIFHETDMYTIHLPEGGRDLVLEQGLHELETKFSSIRKHVLARGLPIEPDNKFLLCAFIAASQFRTPLNREHQSKQWGRALEMMDKINEWAKTATEEERQREAMRSSLSSNRDAMSYDEVRMLSEQPLQTMLFQQILALAPLLFKVTDMSVLVTADEIGFITSDNPVIWSDPEAYKRPPLMRSPALIYETVEITMPISPERCLFLNRRGISGYKHVSQKTVDVVNRLVRFAAKEHFIVNTNKTNDYWFQKIELPDDAWDKTNKRVERKEDEKDS